MTFKLTTYTLHEIGRQTHQEDVLFPTKSKIVSDDRLFIICDGAGNKRGTNASKTVCEAVARHILQHSTPEGPFADTVLQQAVDYAYSELDKMGDLPTGDIGTTLALIKFHEQGAIVAYIGGSSIFQVRPANRKAEAQLMFRSTLQQKDELMKPCQAARPTMHTAHIQDIQPDDIFFICSDGMLEFLDDERVLYHLTKPGCSGKDKANILMQATVDNRDNHSAHLIHVTKVKGRTPAAVTQDKGGVKELIAQMVADYHEFRQFFKGKRLNTRGYITLGSTAVVLLLILLWMVWPSKKSTAEQDAASTEAAVPAPEAQADEPEEVSIADFGIDDSYDPGSYSPAAPSTPAAPKREQKKERKTEEKKPEPAAPEAAPEPAAEVAKPEPVPEGIESTPKPEQIASPSPEVTLTPGTDPTPAQ